MLKSPTLTTISYRIEQTINDKTYYIDYMKYPTGYRWVICHGHSSNRMFLEADGTYVDFPTGFGSPEEALNVWKNIFMPYEGKNPFQMYAVNMTADDLYGMRVENSFPSDHETMYIAWLTEEQFEFFKHHEKVKDIRRLAK